MSINRHWCLPLLCALAIGCSDNTQPAEDAAVTGAAVVDPAPVAAESAQPAISRNPDRNAYFGDLHVHTTYSFDAFIFGTRATPDDAYRYAKGEALIHPAMVFIWFRFNPS